jgi:hypothetical protein
MPNPNEVNVIKNSSGQLACDPETVQAQGRNATITFRLQVDGYAFRNQNAIVVENPGTQFPDPSQNESTKVAKLRDLNSLPGTFKYTVYLTASDGSSVAIDPDINNNP